MKRLTLLIALLLPAAALFGCDSESDTPAAERIVGTWAVASANVDVVFIPGAPATAVPVVDANDQVQVAFADGRYTLTVTGPISATVAGQPITLLPAGETATATGGYDISEDGDIEFTPDVAENETPFTGSTTYRFRGDDRLDFTVENTAEGRALIATLLGEEVPAVLLDAIAGGSATLSRAN